MRQHQSIAPGADLNSKVCALDPEQIPFELKGVDAEKQFVMRPVVVQAVDIRNELIHFKQVTHVFQLANKIGVLGGRRRTKAQMMIPIDGARQLFGQHHALSGETLLEAGRNQKKEEDGEEPHNQARSPQKAQQNLPAQTHGSYLQACRMQKQVFVN